MNVLQSKLQLLPAIAFQRPQHFTRKASIMYSNNNLHTVRLGSLTKPRWKNKTNQHTSFCFSTSPLIIALGSVNVRPPSTYNTIYSVKYIAPCLQSKAFRRTVCRYPRSRNFPCCVGSSVSATNSVHTLFMESSEPLESVFVSFERA